MNTFIELLNLAQEAKNHPDTFWVAAGAIGSVIAALATFGTVIVAIFLYQREKSDKRKRILLGLQFEIYSNILSLYTLPMLEINMLTRSFEQFLDHLDLFDIKNEKDDLFTRIDQLYKNMYFYNSLWNRKGVNYDFLKEVRLRVYFYFLNLLYKFKTGSAEVEMLFDNLSKLLSNVDNLLYSGGEDKMLDALINIKSGYNLFYEENFLRENIKRIYRSSIGEINSHEFAINEITEAMKEYLKSSFGLSNFKDNKIQLNIILSKLLSE